MTQFLSFNIVMIIYKCVCVCVCVIEKNDYIKFPIRHFILHRRYGSKTIYVSYAILYIHKRDYCTAIHC
jgi:hypothetical protein